MYYCSDNILWGLQYLLLLFKIKPYAVKNGAEKQKDYRNTQYQQQRAILFVLAGIVLGKSKQFHSSLSPQRSFSQKPRSLNRKHSGDNLRMFLDHL